MASVILTQPDIALVSDLVGSRVTIAHLVVSDPSEQWDSAIVHFDDGDGAYPVEYRGQSRTGALSCVARFTHAEHADLVALLDLFRTARLAADARLMLRTALGQTSGFDDAAVGVVASWSRPRLTGQAYDVPFTFTRVAYSPEV